MDFFKLLVQCVLLRFEAVAGTFLIACFFREFFLFFSKFFEVFNGFFHFHLVFQLFELLERAVQLLFQRLLVDLHVFELLLNLLQGFWVHFIHKPLHLLIHLLKLIAHDLLHQLLELFLLFEDALFFWAEFVGALVFFAVLLLQLLEVLAERFLLFHQLLHGPLILPINLRVFSKLPAELFHFFAQFCGAFACLPHLFFDVGVGLVAFFADVQLRRRGKGAWGRSRHLRSVDAVVVPHLKPVFEHISLYNTQLREGPFKEKPIGPPTGRIH